MRAQSSRPCSHTPDERIELAVLERAAVYAATARAFFTNAHG